MRVAVLLTTYDWDDTKRRVAERLAPWCDGCDLFLVVDETRTGPADTGPFARLSRTAADYVSRGLPIAHMHSYNPLAWSNDYSLYEGVTRLPPYDYYVVVEDDVAVNTPLRPIVEKVAAGGADCVVSEGPTPVDGWVYAPSAAGLPYPEKLKALLCVLIISRPAALALLQERTRLGRLFLNSELGTWAHSETFVASALQHSGQRIDRLRRFADLSMFSSQFLFIESDARVRRPGTFAHSVLDAKRFERKFVGRTFGSMLQGGKRVELAEA